MTGWSLTECHKKSKFTEAQIVFALQQAESGLTVAEVCRKLGISEATFYSLNKKYSGLGPVELRRLRQLGEKNAQLKPIVADLTLDKQMLQDVLKNKKTLKVQRRRQLVSMLLAEHRVSERRACTIVFLQRTVNRYVGQPRDDRAARQRIKEIAETRVRYGFERIYILLRREDRRDNHKRTYRIYREEGLI